MIAKSRRTICLALVTLALAACRDDSEFTGNPDDTAALNSPPEISGSPARTAEVGRYYTFEPAATDSDGDVLTFKIANRPGWASFNPTNGRLSGTPPGNAASRYDDIRVSVSDGTATVSLPTFDLAIEGGAAGGSQPSISGSPPRRVVVGHAYDFTPQAADGDGDTLSFSISGKPDWLEFDTESGRLHGTPDSSDLGIHNDIMIGVSDGQTNVSLPAFSIEVAAGDTNPPTNTAPTISGVPPLTVVTGQWYRFLPAAADVDGQALSFSISGKPGWASFNADTGQLSGTPSIAAVGVYEDVVITVSDGAAVAALPGFSITVLPANNAPSIGGSPPATVTGGESYFFQPAANDPDGQTLTFKVSGKPAWASFASANGRLSGTPTQAQVGKYSNITITVTDGMAQATLGPFSVEVIAANRAPNLKGSPPTSVAAGAAYDFRPTASDPDGDPLTWSISGKPAWASFSSSSGRLYGTPNADQTGTYSGIVITVSDGELTDKLGPFAINVTSTPTGTATLDWTAPSSNEDGSPLTNLAGYRVYYGRQLSSLGNRIQIPNASVTSATIEDLSAATWYFAVTAYSIDGSESEYSTIVSKTIN